MNATHNPRSRSSARTIYRRRLVGIAVIAVVALAGCSSAEPTLDTVATTEPPPSPGTVTLSVSDVAEAEHLVMLSVIGTNLPTQPIGAACDIVRTDSYAFTGSFAPIVGDHPCALGSEPIVFEPGTYNVIVAVLPGGSTVPHQCTQTAVTVNGNVTVEVSGLGTPADCNW